MEGCDSAQRSDMISRAACPRLPAEALTGSPIRVVISNAELSNEAQLTPGPLMVLTVPPIRKSMGWKPAEKIPTTYPRELGGAVSRTDPQFPTGLAGQPSASRTTRHKMH